MLLSVPSRSASPFLPWDAQDWFCLLCLSWMMLCLSVMTLKTLSILFTNMFSLSVVLHYLHISLAGSVIAAFFFTMNPSIHFPPSSVVSCQSGHWTITHVSCSLCFSLFSSWDTEMKADNSWLLELLPCPEQGAGSWSILVFFTYLFIYL